MPSIQKAVEKFFDPCLTLYWRGKKGDRLDYWYIDLVKDRAIFRQFLHEAGVKQSLRCPPDKYDDLLRVAGEHGYSLETIGFELCESTT